MKRRGFLAACAGLLAAPLAAVGGSTSPKQIDRSSACKDDKSKWHPSMTVHGGQFTLVAGCGGYGVRKSCACEPCKEGEAVYTMRDGTVRPIPRVS